MWCCQWHAQKADTRTMHWTLLLPPAGSLQAVLGCQYGRCLEKHDVVAVARTLWTSSAAIKASPPPVWTSKTRRILFVRENSLSHLRCRQHHRRHRYKPFSFFGSQLSSLRYNIGTVLLALVPPLLASSFADFLKSATLQLWDSANSPTGWKESLWVQMSQSENTLWGT